MEYGIAILISAIIGSFTFLIKDIIRETTEGLWLRVSNEINKNDEVIVLRNGKELYEGKVLRFGLRNTLISRGETSTDLDFIKNSKIFKWTVRKKEVDLEEEKDLLT